MLWSPELLPDQHKSEVSLYFNINVSLHRDVKFHSCRVKTPRASIYYVSTDTRNFDYNNFDSCPREFIQTGKIVDAKWIFAAIRSSDQSGSKGLVETIDGVNKLISLGEFRHLDQVIKSVNPCTANRQILLGLARSTYPVRSKLSNWKLFIFDIHKAFLDRKLDAERLLRGLIER